MLPFIMAYGAEMIGDRGNSDGAMALLDRATELIHLTGEQWCEPEIVRLRARFGSYSPEEKIKLLEIALRKAGEQGAKFWQLRCATDLSRIWLDEGNRDECLQVLTPVFDWFTEGFYTIDLLAARALLDRCNSCGN